MFVLFTLLFCGVFFVACKDNSKPKNQVSDIVISEKFSSASIYQNSILDLSQFEVYIINTIDSEQTFTLDQFLPNSLDTSRLGVHTFSISYNGKTKAFNYTVLPENVVGARYNGEPITFYKHEGADLENKQFLVLYSSGKEKYFDLSMAEINFENTSISGEIETAVASFQGQTFNVEYVVKNREIEFGTYYDFYDNTSQQNECDRKVVFSKSSDKITFTIFTIEDSVPVKEYSGTAKESGVPHEYTFSAISNQELKSFILYLTSNGVVKDFA